MNYSHTPGHVRCVRFKATGKFYEEFMLDMTDAYHSGPYPNDAVIDALLSAGRLGDQDTMSYVVLDPYHHGGSVPVMVHAAEYRARVEKKRQEAAAEQAANNAAGAFDPIQALDAANAAQDDDLDEIPF